MVQQIITIVSVFIGISCFGQKNGEFTFYEVDNSLEIFNSVKETKDTSFSGTDTTWIVTRNWDTKQLDTIKVFLEYVAGERIKATGYYTNGNKYRETNYKSKKEFGHEIIYHPNGNPSLYYFNDEENKYPVPGIHFYPDGSVKCLSYKIDSIERSYCYYPSGALEAATISHDSLNGGYYERQYLESGELNQEGCFNMGRQIFVTYYDTGHKFQEGYIYNAIWNKLGKWQFWYYNGTLKLELYFDENIPNMKQGIWSYWDEKGNLVKQETYKDNKLIEVKEFVSSKDKQD